MALVFQNLVEHFGGQSNTAEALGVDQSAVSRWVRGKHGMSPAVALRAAKLTGGRFTAAELCPAVFAVQPSEVASR